MQNLSNDQNGLAIRRTHSADCNDIFDTDRSINGTKHVSVKASQSVDDLAKGGPSDKPVTKAFKAFFHGKHKDNKRSKTKQSEDESLGTSSYQSERELEEIWSKALSNFDSNQTWKPFEKDAGKVVTRPTPLKSKAAGSVTARYNKPKTKKRKQQPKRVNNNSSADRKGPVDVPIDASNNLPELMQMIQQVEAHIHKNTHVNKTGNDQRFLPVVPSWQISGQELLEHLEVRPVTEANHTVIRPCFVDRATQTGTDNLALNQDKANAGFHGTSSVDHRGMLEYVTSQVTGSPPPDVISGSLKRGHSHPRENPLLLSARKGHVDTLVSEPRHQCLINKILSNEQIIGFDVIQTYPCLPTAISPV